MSYHIFVLTDQAERESQLLEAGKSNPRLSFHFCHPRDFADQRVHLDRNELFINQQGMHAFLLLVSPHHNFSASYAGDTQQFCNTEMKALILDILHTEGIFVLNRFAANQWMTGMSWDHFRLLFRQEGVPLRALHFGENPAQEKVWFSYAHSHPRPHSSKLLEKSLSVASLKHKSEAFGETWFYRGSFWGANSPSLSKAGEVLSRHGLNFGRFLLDQEGAIVLFDPVPESMPSVVLSSIIQEIHENANVHTLNR